MDSNIIYVTSNVSNKKYEKVVKNMSKDGTMTYVLNKPSLLRSKDSLLRYPKNEIVIPMAVLEDIQKTASELDFARRVIAKNLLNYLDSLDLKNLTSTEGIKLENEGTLRIALNYKEIDISVDGLNKKDKRILQTCIGLKNQEKKNVILISNDPVLRIKAKTMGIRAEEQKDDLFPKISEQYNGKKEVWISKKAMETLYDNRALEISKVFETEDINWTTNLYLIMKTPEGASALGCFDGNVIVPIPTNFSPFGIMPKNLSQTFLMHALLDSATPLVIVKGEAGTGKTICALAAGLEQTTEKGNRYPLYDQILISTADDYNKDRYGFLPGELTEKIDPYVQGVYDNLSIIINSKKEEKDGISISEKGEYYLNNGKIKIQALRCNRGRSISKTYYIFDETQNIPPDFMKTIITRAGQDSKFIFLGDPTQIDAPGLDERYNGLVYISELMKGQSLCRQISFTESSDVIRSPLAKLAVKLM